MSDSKASSRTTANKNSKRNLPPWMGSREHGSKSHGNEPADGGVQKENNEAKKSEHTKESGNLGCGITPPKEIKSNKNSSPSSLGAASFSKLLEGVVFVLSGFVNPERSMLRSQALEMGAEYQPDWNDNCTLLICAFPNTPKFRQVEADYGTIVSKEWISECYNQKKLVDIEIYLMHAGKPWKRQNISPEASQELESSVSRRTQRQTDRRSHAKPTAPVSTKSGSVIPAKECFSASKVKTWAIDDLNKTISWLESQDEKPEDSEIRKIAAEGILVCLQDAIDLLKQNQDLGQLTEQWQCIPRVVEELARLEGAANGSAAPSKKDLCREAMTCKQIYEAEFNRLDDESFVEKKRARTKETKDDNKKNRVDPGDAPAYDSDETIGMTEEEIDLAYNTVAPELSRHGVDLCKR
ncbi:DNA-repair protein XRCC1 isoform X2 [Diospyros lotus]|nr:DNA-repair protein XRCC1 isoform X2 [Diospyros lotus]XP_052182565.1 DNA-repair protein XRCC1 isoform X2 [Diospyros lotus]XP_052182566.1 DNA-repair protein XRCC1 isoform X2 [Diospyros lotus]XP_052182567.1 DNA-repair protein XRCC1 isoform X2 [Diospyros lotus]